MGASSGWLGCINMLSLDRPREQQRKISEHKQNPVSPVVFASRPLLCSQSSSRNQHSSSRIISPPGSPSKGSPYLVSTSRPSLGRSALSGPPLASFQGCLGIFFHLHGASLASKHYKHHLTFPFLIKITKSLLHV